MTIARWGVPILLWTAVLTVWALVLLPAGPARWCGAVGGAVIIAGIAFFFRNPRRSPEGDADHAVAPADGVVADIEEVDEPRFLCGRAIRVGVFMSVFDVHVNRAPLDGVIRHAQYHPGSFADVRTRRGKEANEWNFLGLEADARPGLRFAVRQIAGLVARRIVCTHGVGDRLGRGEIFGMIRFGSRLEVYLPVGTAEIVVAVGQRVASGRTILARLLPVKEVGRDPV